MAALDQLPELQDKVSGAWELAVKAPVWEGEPVWPMG
jgi:hypothetical protein